MRRLLLAGLVLAGVARGDAASAQPYDYVDAWHHHDGSAAVIAGLAGTVIGLGYGIPYAYPPVTYAYPVPAYPYPPVFAYPVYPPVAYAYPPRVYGYYAYPRGYGYRGYYRHYPRYRYRY